jgi:hypothetical protein
MGGLFFMGPPSRIPPLPRIPGKEVVTQLDESIHLSVSEIRGALAGLRRADIVRLSMLAKNWVRGLGRPDADDLLNEAFERVLAGRRP